MGLEGLKKWTIDLPYGYYMYKFPYKFPYGHLAGYVWVFPMKVLQTQGSGSGRRAQVTVQVTCPPGASAGQLVRTRA